MAKIIVETDCGNAPRKEFIKQFHVAIANGDLNFVSNGTLDTIQWELVGNQVISNKEDFEKGIVESPLWDVKTLVIDTIITHGHEASANGSVITKNNLKFAFSNVYGFKGFKGTLLKSIRTYLIEL